MCEGNIGSTLGRALLEILWDQYELGRDPIKSFSSQRSQKELTGL